MGKSLETSSGYKNRKIQIKEVEFLVDLILLEFQDFDVILGMDFLTKYNATLDCKAKTVCLRSKDSNVKFRGKKRASERKWISALKAEKLLRQGARGYLTCVQGKSEEPLKVKEVRIVREFGDVFLEELPGLPPQVLSIKDQGRRYAQDSFSFSIRTLQISGDAVLTDQCPSSFYGYYESSLQAILRQICDRVYRRYTDILSLGRRARITFKGHVIWTERISVDPDKIATVANWKQPRSVTEIKSFLGLAGYYRKFVEGFSKITTPLTKLTQKGVKFDWSERCEESFQKLKDKLTTAPVLAMQNGSGGFMVYTDASRNGLGCVLMQHGRVIPPGSRQLKNH
ncbi:uncharacterized protein LOC127796310 [Diospyros lotus]|uniref:uncharacterized protein LOC127796310 n=1 Tax=Diospyros lotus TaxID=55363 RepID=UPI00224EDAD4|nr:uncharacterized protein LOC127796310 [Diospyros lotus]